MAERAKFQFILGMIDKMIAVLKKRYQSRYSFVSVRACLHVKYKIIKIIKIIKILNVQLKKNYF